MTDSELKEYIKINPESELAHAYRLGRKDELVSMQPEINRVLNRLAVVRS